ncbi:MAG: hypothetical protein A2516_02730 [Alphaproteobacteria bacterium RIFOXYD12_FULL_60_8]|nr:MAG: hypothetical protein A2516_02730 [Alphaproteobacteria bacterium RIFOXYD12_FULL_60_8]
MAQVTLNIQGRSYTIVCDDGQEAHLTRLGRYLDSRAKELTAAIGQVNESLLLVMVSLLVADELSDAYGELEHYQGPLRTGAKSAKAKAEGDLADRIAQLTGRIEALARNVEQA